MNWEIREENPMSDPNLKGEPDNSPGNPSTRPGQLQIEMDEPTAQGAYVNFAIVGHTETEFTVDFVFLQPQQPKGRVRARIITAPSHAKRLLMALDANIKKFEKSFGPIKAAQQPEKKIGFTQL